MRFVLPLLLALVTQAPLGAADLPTTLSKMNAVSAQYTGMTAKIRSVSYTKLVDETETGSGDIWVRRDAKGQVTLRIAFSDPAPRQQIRVEGASVEIFKEGINQIEEYDLKDKREQLEEALLVGFGASGDYLQKRYDIQLVGEETLAAESVAKLLLTPKDPDARASGRTLEMWVSTSKWQPVQQKLNQADGDYRLYAFTDMQINPGVKNSDLNLDLSRTKTKPKRIKPRF